MRTHVSADSAEWIHAPVRQRAPQAVLCPDAFHVVAWATAALDATRRQVWNELRAAGKPAQASTLKGSRWALVKNPSDLTGKQRTTLASIATTNKGLYRAYLLKEQLRAVFASKAQPGRALLAGWLAWAHRSRLPAFVKLAKTIKRYRPVILKHPGPRAVQRPRRGHQHTPARPDPPGLRLPQPPSPHRHDPTHPRRTLPHPPRTIMPTETTQEPRCVRG